MIMILSFGDLVCLLGRVLGTKKYKRAISSVQQRWEYDIVIIISDDGEDMKMRTNDTDYHPITSILVPEFSMWCAIK